MRIIGVALLVLNMGAAGLAQTQPATRPADRIDPSPESAQRLVLETIRELAEAENATLRFEVADHTEPVEANPEKPLPYSTQDTSQTLLLSRPDRLKFTMVGPKALDASRLEPTLIFDGKTYFVVFEATPGKQTIRSGPLKVPTVDHVLRSQPLMLTAFSPAISRLATRDAEVDLASNATDWKWLGAATDSRGSVWRVSFRLPQLHGKHQLADWEVWVTAMSPHQLARVIVRWEDVHGHVEIATDPATGNQSKRSPTTRSAERLKRGSRHGISTPFRPRMRLHRHRDLRPR